VAVNESGRRFAEEVLPSLLRPEALDRIEWHKAQGDVVAIVSGAFDCYLSHWCQVIGLELLCSSFELDACGKLTGRYNGAQCVGYEKVRRIRQRFDLASYAQVYAYGDTKEDHAMLDVASKKVYRWREAA
jgi:phosphatidylglycerophosphatase C